MNKNELFKDTKQLLLDALSKENEVVIALAYSYAKNLDKYGVDINALWDNQEKNSQALGRAYTEGYFDGLKQAEDDKNRGGYEEKWIPTSEAMPTKTGFYLIQYSRKYCHDELAVAYYSVEEKRSDPDYEWEFRPMEHEYEEVVAWMPLPKMCHTGREE